MNNKGKIEPKQPKQHQKRDKKTSKDKKLKDWLEQKRTSKDGKGLVRTEKDY